MVRKIWSAVVVVYSALPVALGNGIPWTDSTLNYLQLPNCTPSDACETPALTNTTSSTCFCDWFSSQVCPSLTYTCASPRDTYKLCRKAKDTCAGKPGFPSNCQLCKGLDGYFELVDRLSWNLTSSVQSLRFGCLTWTNSSNYYLDTDALRAIKRDCAFQSAPINSSSCFPADTLDPACVCTSLDKETICGKNCTTWNDRYERIDFATQYCREIKNWKPEVIAEKYITVQELVPWSWRLKYQNASTSHNVTSSNSTSPKCPSARAKLGAFAAVNLSVLALLPILSRRTVLKWLTFGYLGKPISPFWVLTGALSAAFNVISNVFNATMVHKAPGVSTFPIGQLILLWCTRPRVAWLIVALMPWQVERHMYVSASLSAITAELILQGIASVYIGRVANHGRKFKFYESSYAISPGTRQASHLMYAGCLLWLIVVIAACAACIFAVARVAFVLIAAKLGTGIRQTLGRKISETEHRARLLKSSVLGKGPVGEPWAPPLKRASNRRENCDCHERKVRYSFDTPEVPNMGWNSDCVHRFLTDLDELPEAYKLLDASMQRERDIRSALDEAKVQAEESLRSHNNSRLMLQRWAHRSRECEECQSRDNKLDEAKQKLETELTTLRSYGWDAETQKYIYKPQRIEGRQDIDSQALEVERSRDRLLAILLEIEYCDKGLGKALTPSESAAAQLPILQQFRKDGYRCCDRVSQDHREIYRWYLEILDPIDKLCRNIPQHRRDWVFFHSTWERYFSSLGGIDSKRFVMSSTLITSGMATCFLAQWLWWVGFVRLLGDEYCPPKLSQQVGVWITFSALGVASGASS